MTDSFFGIKNLRNLHRDFGYFFIGLIFAFCISGIMLNHRSTWNPVKYKYDFKKVKTDFRLPKASITLVSIKKFNDQNKIVDFQSFDFQDDSTLVIFFKNGDATIHLADGKGEINFWRQRPLLAQFYFLHVAEFDNAHWYVWYSDIFALGLMFIALTGMFLMKGKNSFRKRGWLFALAGIIVPIIALLLFYGIL